MAVSRAKTGSKMNGISKITLSGPSPEKAGVGGSIPSLATTFSTVYNHSHAQIYSISFQNSWLDVFAFVE